MCRVYDHYASWLLDYFELRKYVCTYTQGMEGLGLKTYMYTFLQFVHKIAFPSYKSTFDIEFKMENGRFWSDASEQLLLHLYLYNQRLAIRTFIEI